MSTFDQFAAKHGLSHEQQAELLKAAEARGFDVSHMTAKDWASLGRDVGVIAGIIIRILRFFGVRV